MLDRFYNFSVVTYLEESVFLPFLQNMPNLKHYAYAFHDRDIDENGKLKESHTHILLLFSNNRTISSVCKAFPRGQNTFAQPLFDKCKAFEYLTHENDEDKYHYPKSIIKSDCFNYFVDLCNGKEKSDVDEKTIAILKDIIANVPPFLLLERWGRDVVMNYKKYKEFAELCKSYNCITPAKMPASLIDEETGEVVAGKLKR